MSKSILRLKMTVDNEDLMNELQAIKQLLLANVRSKLSNKQQRLYEEVRHRGRMNSVQIKDFLKVSNTYAHTLMKQLNEMPGFSLSKGSREQRRSSVIMYDDAKKIKDENNKLLELFSVKEIITLSEVMAHFGIDLAEAKHIAYQFVEQYQEYKLEENKIIKKQ